MGFLSNINFGSSNTSAFNSGSTSSFDFGQIAGAVTSNASDGQGGINAGSAINAGLDAAASAIPFGSTIKKALDALGLQEQINNVSKYGLSSWGASTSPEEMKVNFQQKVLPFVVSTLESIEQNPGNMDASLDEVDMQLRSNLMYHEARTRLSSAKSSQLGHKFMASEYKKLLNTVIPEFISQFKKHGVIIKKKVSNRSPHDMPFLAYLADEGQLWTTSKDKYMVGKTFYEYDVDFSHVKVDENGQIEESKSSSFGLLALGSGLLYAIKTGALKI